MELRPLVCPACSAAVPLGEGTVAKCPYCAGEVAIPAEYLTLRDDDRAEIEARKRAAEMIEELAAPLPLPLVIFRKLGTVALCTVFVLLALGLLFGLSVAFSDSDGFFLLALIFAVFVALLAVPTAWEWLLRALADKLHVDLVDRLSGFVAHMLLGVVVTVFLLVPLALGYYARRMIAVRTRLQAMYASKPPERPGGPARCRHCDAPLDVPAGVLGVRCLYCGTDNLVALTQAVVTAATTSAAESSKVIDEAVSKQRQTRDDTFGQLKLIAIVAVLVMPIFGGLGLVTELVMDEGGSPAHLHRASGTPVLSRDGKHWPQGDVPLDCASQCTFYVALAAGQTIDAHGGDSVIVERRDIGPWYHLDWWEWTALEPGPVKHTGWYRVVVSSSASNPTLTWSVKP